MIPKLNSTRNQARRRRIFFMRANEASKPIDSPGGTKLAWWFFPPCACAFAGAFFSRFRGGKTFPGFPFGLHRDGPSWAVSGPYRMAHRGTLSRAWGDVLSPRRKASAQDAPAGLCARSYRVPDATSDVSSVPGRTHRRGTRKPHRTKPRQIRRPSPRCGAS